MKMTTAAFCLFLFTFYARADFIIVESTDLNTMPQLLSIIKIKGDKLREDLGVVSTTIVDFNTGEVIDMSPIGKDFSKWSAQQAKDIFDKGRPSAARPAWPSGRVKFTDAGKKEKVLGIEAEIYTAQVGESKITIWVTKDIPHYAGIMQQMKKWRVMEEVSFLDTSDIDGIPVKTAVEWKGGTRVSTLVSVKELPLDDVDFQVPSDYKPRP